MDGQNPVSPSVRAAAVTRLRRRLDAAGAGGAITVSVSMLNHVVAEHDDAKQHSREAVNAGRAEAQETARWRDAFERLHTRIHRDLDFEAGETSPPDDERWAHLLDDLVAYADRLHPEIKTEASR